MTGITISTKDTALNVWNVYYDGVQIVWTRSGVPAIRMDMAHFNSAITRFFNTATTDAIVLTDPLGNTTTMALDVAAPPNLTITTAQANGAFSMLDVVRILAFLQQTD